ncbi:hypothetical protein HNR60_001161 [Rhodopseudomonas rhenobacensis]|uniref:Uncharacterized protein n=1 Tax=Rhodopseudomonas rhenobacensis TaxID=87461 RepID=A0A7W8DZ04_9BRAD|nr:hypothetical protein [Rhodopseudomonas rhenobacensis]MBB5046416.1 hypothetical protein [Rhodopseudomonas rhenobacensis]
MTKRHANWDTRSLLSKSAHVVERIGLAMAGAACGLFVAANLIRSNVDLGAGGIALAMLLFGAVGFYLGIDLPPPLHDPDAPPPPSDVVKTDSVELFSATGTFLTALAAVISVYAIVADERMALALVLSIGVAWMIGTTMQVAAGVIARLRRSAA